MVHYVFWLFSAGAPASQPASQGGGGVPKPPSHPAAPRRSSNATGRLVSFLCIVAQFLVRWLLAPPCQEQKALLLLS